MPKYDGVYQKKYRLAHKEKYKEYMRAYYKLHRTKLLELNAEYRRAHKKQIIDIDRAYHLSHKEEIARTHRAYYQLHKERIKRRVATYRESHKNKENIYRRNRYKKDTHYRLSVRLRGRISCAIKRNYKTGSAIHDLGCTIPELKAYLETRFKKGMTWDNWSQNGWHIDHRIPLSLFDLADRDQFLQACHYTNLQPMWGEENVRKGSKVVY